MVELAGLAVLLLVLGSVFGWVSLIKTRRLEDRVEELTRRVQQGAAAQPSAQSTAQPTVAMQPEPATASAVASTSTTEKAGWPPVDKSPAKNAFPNQYFQAAVKHLQQHWMIWLGGICVGLAGILMVRYSIEAGWLTAGARIALALLIGVALHVAAYWLYRRLGPQPAFAALAGGASITLYAAVLAATHLYGLIQPGTAFALMAAISAGTMVLALGHGPVLAILGIAGAYVVPLLVSDGRGDVTVALVYALIIASGGLWLCRHVYRSWLWLGTLAGALAWWWLGVIAGADSTVIGGYLAALGYGVLSIPQRDWALQKTLPISERVSADKASGHASGQPNIRALLSHLQKQALSDTPTAAIVLLSVALLAAAHSASITHLGMSANQQPLLIALISWLPLLLIVLIGARKAPGFAIVSWFFVVAQLAAWLVFAVINASGKQGAGIAWPPLLAEPLQPAFCLFAIFQAVVLSGFAAWHYRRRAAAAWAAMAVTSPLLWLALTYLLTDALAQRWHWALIIVAVGGAYLAAARERLATVGSATQISDAANKNADSLAVWLILAGHFAYSLAAVVMANRASLTLALAAQLLSLAWIVKRFQLGELGWLIKLVVAIVVIRLTLNPWLTDYASSQGSWFATYAGATLCCAIAAYLLRSYQALRAWLELAALQLLVLTLWSQTRYWLYNGALFSQQYSFTEAAINTNLWAGIGFIYLQRAVLTKSLAMLYRIAGYFLLTAAAFNYVALITWLNPLWNARSDEQISSLPLLNRMLLAYLSPFVLAALVARSKLVSSIARRLASVFAAIAALVFINLQIRHLWNGKLDLSAKISAPELYSYSAVWLVIAALILLLSASKHRAAYRVGLAILASVIFKIFIIDMDGLTGMLLVASFMGLGLCLLVLGYLLRRGEREG